MIQAVKKIAVTIRCRCRLIFLTQAASVNNKLNHPECENDISADLWL